MYHSIAEPITILNIEYINQLILIGVNPDPEFHIIHLN
jgi:hypothetical protein